MTAARTSSDTQVLGPLAGRLIRGGLLVGAAAVVASLLIVWIDGGVGVDRLLRSWLTAFMFVTSLALGGLFFTFVQHATHAGWGVSTRRIAEAFAGNLAWIWILFLPVLLVVLFGRGSVLYPWADSTVVEHDHVLAGKTAYLNPAFWSIRAVVYLAVWAVLGRFFLRTSIAQDATGGVALTHRMQRWAPLAALIYAFTQSYAAVDWAMTLEPAWFSTMYPVYYFAASCCGVFAAMILAIMFLQRRGRIEADVTAEHYQDLGKLLFGFGICFWGYIAFSQFMLIWYASIPEETNWYLARTLGGWRTVSWLLFWGHFAVPFVLLMSRHAKRFKPMLAVLALWMLAIHYVDVYWLVMPKVPAEAFERAATLVQLREEVAAGTLETGFSPHLIDLTCLVALLSFFVAGTALGLRRCSLVPAGDPRLPEAMAFENY